MFKINMQREQLEPVNTSIPASSEQLTQPGNSVQIQQPIDNTETNEKTYELGTTAGREGSSYEIELSMLFLYRGIKSGKPFELAPNMKEARKFDDIVFKYTKIAENGTEEKISLLLQAKHRTNESNKIKVEELLTESDTDFTLVKYFNSYNNTLKDEQKRQEEGKGKLFGTIEKVILYTNIDFDYDEIKSYINFIQIENNNILSLKDNLVKINPKKQPVYCQFKKGTDFVEELKEKLHKPTKLAKTLIDHILNLHPIKLDQEPILKEYHVVLVDKKVIETQKDEKGNTISIKKFHDDFIADQNLDIGTQKFRDAFVKELKNHQGIFLSKFVLNLDRKITDLKNTIRKKEDGKKKTKLDLDNPDDFKKKTEQIQNIENTIQELTVQQKNLEDIKNEIEQNENFVLKDINNYIVINAQKINAKNFGEEEQGNSNIKSEWPEDTVSDKDIEEFLDHLVYAVNQPNESELGKIIAGEIKDIAKEDKDINFKDLPREWIADRIKSKIEEEYYTGKTNEREFLTPKRGKEYLNDIMQMANTLMPSIKYCEELNDSGIYFNKEKNELITLNNFLEDKEKQIFHLTVLDETLLSAIKIYWELVGQKYNSDHFIFIKLSDLLRPHTQQGVVSTYNNSLMYNLLIIEYESTARKDDITGLYSNLYKILNSSSSKKIILIAKQDDPLANEFAEYYKDRKDKYESKGDQTSFNDLTEDSQRKILEKEVTFQEKPISLNKLIDKNNEGLKNLIDSETLENLINGKPIVVGSEPMRFSSLEAVYSKINKELQENNLIDALTKDEKSLFMISGITQEDSDITNTLVQLLGINQENDKIHTAIKEKRLYIKTEQNKDINFEQFKQLCHDNSDQRVYWINWKNNQFIWQQLYNPIYLDRKFQQIVIKKDIKEDLIKTTLSDLFIFSGIYNKEQLMKLLKISDKQEKQQFFNNINKGNIKLTSPTKNQDVESIFQEKLLQYPSKCIHWFKIEQVGNDQYLIWKRSNNSLSELRQYIDNDNNKLLLLDESEFSEQKNKVVIIADKPGIGKSNALTRLSEQKLETNWVIRINLKDCQDAISRLPTSQKEMNLDDIINFLVEIDNTGLKTLLAQNLVRYYITLKQEANQLLPSSILPFDDDSNDNINNSLPIMLLFDGFDEIKGKDHNIIAQNQEKVIALLKYLKDETEASLWVTTRVHGKEKLEDELSVFATKLEELLPKKQQEFLEKFWEARLSLILSSNQLQHNRFEQYTKALLKKTNTVLGGEISSFMGIPLQLRLLAEYFQENFKKFIEFNDADSFTIPNFNLLELYNHFIENKYRIYLEEKTGLSLSVGFNEVSKGWFYEPLTKVHQRLAFYEMFPDKAKEFLRIKSPFQCNDRNELMIKNTDKQMMELYNVGLIQLVMNKFEFIHQTLVEYFVANLLAHWVKKPVESQHPKKLQMLQDFLLKEILIESNYSVIRAFINDQLKKEFVPESILELYGKEIEELWLNKSLQNDKGKTFLYIAVKEENVQLTKFLLNSCTLYPKVLEDLVNAKDDNGKTVLHHAAKKGNLEIVKWLIGTNKVKIEDTDNYGKTVLHASLYGRFEVVEWLVNEKKADVNAADNNNKTVLHFAIEKMELKEVQWLVGKGADIKITGEYGKTALHYATKKGKFEIVKWLVNEKKADVNAADNWKQTVLLNACDYGDLDIIEWLIKKGANVNITDGVYHTLHKVYHHAVNTDNYKLIPQIIELLLRYSANPNVQDKRGDTLAHYAAERNDVKTLKVLSSKNADFTISNHGNYTAIDACTHDCKRNKDAYKFLLQFSQKTIEEKIALAIQFEDLDNLKEYLSTLSKEGDKKKEELLNTETKYGLIGSIACGIGNLEIIELLEKNGCNLGLIVKDEYTALEKACDADNVELFHSEDRVKLITYLIDDKKIEITGYALHNTLHCSSSEILTLLLDKGVDPDLKYTSNLTPLLYLINLPGVNEEKIEKIKLLLERGANIFMHDGYIGNSLHLAAEMGHIQVINLLLIYAKEKDKLEQLLQLSPEECRTCKGMNAYEIAFKYKRAEAVEILKEYFPNTNLTGMQVIDNSASKCDNTEMEDELDDKRQSNEQRKECLTPQIIDNSSSISDHKINLPQIDINQLNERRKEWLKKFDIQPIDDWDLENKIALMGNSDISTDSD